MEFQTVPEITFVDAIKNNYAEVLKTAAAKKAPIFVINGTKPEAVILDYASWLELAEQSQKPARKPRGSGGPGRKPRAEKTAKK